MLTSYDLNLFLLPSRKIQLCSSGWFQIKNKPTLPFFTVLFLPIVGYPIFIIFVMLSPSHILVTLSDFEGLSPWPLVSLEEFKSHIAQIKGKASGADEIPPEFFKDHWLVDTFLVALLTFIDSVGLMTPEWGTAILVPIFKKGGEMRQQITDPLAN